MGMRESASASERERASKKECACDFCPFPSENAPWVSVELQFVRCAHSNEAEQGGNEHYGAAAIYMGRGGKI
jgi:hypothetical protein